MTPPPTQPLSFRVIVADPPWEYNNRRETRRDNPEKSSKFGIGAGGKYSLGCMTTADLRELGPLVLAVAAPDALLFLWATCPRLPDALALIGAWGFAYATVAFSWEKLYPRSGETFRGPGSYTPSNVELVLVARRGKLWHPNTGSKPVQVFREPHPRDRATGKIIHSRKPERFQDAIMAWLGPHIGGGDYLELFATRAKPGWTCLGYDVTGRDIRVDLVETAKTLAKIGGLRN